MSQGHHPLSEKGDRTGHELTLQASADVGSEPSPEGALAVAQSLAADVIASLVAEAEGGSPRGEPWQTLAAGEAAVREPASLPVPAHGVPHAAAPQAAAPARGELDAESIYDELRGDVARLEELLAAQSVALREARVESEQLRALVRDAAQGFAGLPDAGTEITQAKLERERAAARAIEAEVGRAELAFQLDEVRGHLMALGAAEGALPGEAIHTTCARLAGTVRGLLSARSEAEERGDQGWARAVLLEHDVDDLRSQVRSLQRDLGHAHEQHELVLSEAQALSTKLSGAGDARIASELRGERSGLRARSDEAERALSAARAQLAERAASGARAGSEVDVARQRIAELQQALARETEKLDEAQSRFAKGEAERLVAATEMARTHAELELLREEHERARSVQRGELGRLSDARAAVERLAAERGRSLAESSSALHEVRDVLVELATAVERVMRTESATVADQTEPGGPAPFE